MKLLKLPQNLVKQKKINVSSSIDNNITVLGSGDKLFRAFLNIIDNAIKYTEAGGAVKISFTQRGGRAKFKVKDTGIGISKKDLPHIFERFYRGSRHKNVHGAGLGLAISQAIIVAHKGAIEVKSEIGQGTTTTVSLPTN